MSGLLLVLGAFGARKSIMMQGHRTPIAQDSRSKGSLVEWKKYTLVGFLIYRGYMDLLLIAYGVAATLNC